MAPPVISIVGKSDSGKTTLIEKLIPALSKRGYKVATIKHDVHRFEMDHPGKDTYRHFTAGAQMVLIASPEKMAFQKRMDGPIGLDEAVETYMSDMDVVLTEGYKSADKPKIEVFRRSAHRVQLCGPEDNLVAMATDDAVDVTVPVFGLNDVEGIVDFIIDKFLR